MLNRILKLLGGAGRGVVLVMIGGGLWLSSVAAQSKDVPAVAERSYNEAWLLQKAAEDASAPEEVRDDLQRALAKCDEATKSQPDYFKAQALAAHCDHRLSQLRSLAGQHQELLKSARDRFALAALCSGADPALYLEWGGMLIIEVSATTRPVERESLLREARRIFTAGLTVTGLAGERAKVERDLGTCLTMLATETVDVADKRTLLEEAIERFTSAAKVESLAGTPELCGHWGVALVEYSKLTNNRMTLRQGVERLETAVEKGTDGADLSEVHYNLACAYSLLGQPDQAMQHLRFCLAHDDDKHSYFNAAPRDPDLRPLEVLPEFNDLFKEQPPVSINHVIKPSLSDE